jgi:2-methylcitrate dehydratase
MVAVPLIQGSLDADDYEDAAAANPLIDALRGKMDVVENPRFTREYLEPDKRAIGNAVQVFFNDGSATEKISVDYPIGHRRRRAEGIPLLEAKFERYLRGRISQKNADAILEICADQAAFERCSVERMMGLLAL